MLTSTALTSPSASPTAIAIANIPTQPSGQASAAEIAAYCATDAVAVKEMSMPPEISTTSRPAARMPVKA